jgi:hypothetical protein
MLQTDHRRAIAKAVIHGAIAMLVAAELKDLDPSDKKIIPVALKKLTSLAQSIVSLKPPSNDSVAGKLSAVALSLMNCNDPVLKGAAHAEISKAAKIFDEMSLGS